MNGRQRETAGSGSVNEARALALMLDELAVLESPAEVRVVRFRRG